MQRAHLVVHQRNQGRHHNGHPQTRLLAGNGRYLVAQGFAATCGHEYQRIAPLSDVFNNGLLWPAELRVAKYPVQDSAQ